MREVAVFLLTGLGAGAVYAALALGLVLTYKGTGTINFATGAMAAWGAFVYSELRATGRLVAPLAWVPASFRVGDLGTIGSIAVAAMSSCILGLIVHLAVFRPMRSSPMLAKVVASAGVMLAVQALISLRFGVRTRTVKPILPTGTVTIAGIRVPGDRLYLAAIVLLVGIACAIWLKTTRVGIAVRASSDRETAASLAGRSPQLLAALTWGLSSGVTGVIVILASPITGLNPTNYTLFVVPALACALVGRLRSVVAGVAAGLGLGAIGSEMTYASTKPWWPSWATRGIADVVPFVMVVVALFLVGRSLPTRSSVAVDRLPTVPRERLHPIGVGTGVLAATVLTLVTSGSYRFGVITSLAFAVISLSFFVLTGLLGQISFAQAAIAGVAGFALSELGQHTAIPFPISPVLAAGAAAVVGVLVGLPALRIRGAQLAVVTLAAASAVEQFVLRNPRLNGASGNPVDGPELFGWDLSVRAGTNTARWQFAALAIVVLTGCAVAVANLARGATGRTFLAVRANERASASAGVDVAAAKLIGFAIASFLAGLGGTLLAYSRGSISAESFTAISGVTLLVFAYLGGIARVSGALIAGLMAPLGLLYVIVDRRIGTSGVTYQLVAACGLVATAVLHPDGVAGAFHRRGRPGRPRVPADLGEHTDPAPRQLSGAPRDRPCESVLEVRNLSVRFGGVRALDRVDLEVRYGRVTGLIGANGAGKTTLIDAISGFVPSDGSILLDGRPLGSVRAHRRARAGIGRTWQSLELFEDLTVLENLELVPVTLRLAVADMVAPSRHRADDAGTDALRTLGVEHLAHRPAGELTLGERRLVTVARALTSQPRVVLLDEPAAGLSDAERYMLGGVVRDVAAAGVGVLLIEHDVAFVSNDSDEVYALDFGRVVAHGSAADVLADPAVRRAYLGTATDPQRAGTR